MEFKLDDSFVEKYKNIKPDFGFNGLGELVYLRTYSRLKEDGKKEKWYETIRRVVEGTYSIQKKHIESYNLGWIEEKAQRSAQEMYDRMFHMLFLPPGRGLYAMGTDIVHKKGLFASLNNCSFVSTENIDKELTRPFEFMMEFSMLGVGVGFDTKGAGKIIIKQPSEEEFIHVIPDTREGWVESLRLSLEAWFLGKPVPKFDYSKLRKKGEIIKTFGGKASGPEPLKKVHRQIIELFKDRAGQYISSTDITNLMNYIGVAIVSGNVRRTSQIALGNVKDKDYLDLKNYEVNPQREEFGWASNNSIIAETGQDYTEIAKRINVNGEPGLFWLENAKKYSRMCDPIDYRDDRAQGTNPCGEQTLESYEMCCLTEVFPTRHEDLQDFLRTLKFAYLYAKTVTLGNTHWIETNRVQLRNRRIGTSISGLAQFIDSKGTKELIKWMKLGYSTIQHYDEIYSDWFAVPRSIKTTSIKPSGTVSLLPGVTPGVHFPEANYYIRRVRLSTESDLIDKLKEAGYKIEKDLFDDYSYVVEIPVKIEGVRTLDEVTMWEQFLVAEMVQKYWSDNQVSVTVTFNEKESSQIANALNYFQYKLKSVSMLPRKKEKAYKQMPYEKITKAKYNKLVNKIKQVDFYADAKEDSKPELYCDTEACEIM